MSNVDIYSILSSKPHNKHYLNRYFNFIQQCCQANSSKTKEELGYTEKHHICPKAKDMFPEYKSFKKHPWNKITLTSKQHFEAHELLWKAYGGSQTQAFWMMSQAMNLKSSDYEKLRGSISKNAAIRISKNLKGKAKYKNLDGEVKLYATDDPRIKTGELVSYEIGRHTYVDKDGNKIRCSINDPRVLSGELMSNGIGKFASKETREKQSLKANGQSMYKDKNGNPIRCRPDDTRVLSGELVGITKGNSKLRFDVIYNNGKILYENVTLAFVRSISEKLRKLTDPNNAIGYTNGKRNSMAKNLENKGKEHLVGLYVIQKE